MAVVARRNPRRAGDEHEEERPLNCRNQPNLADRHAAWQIEAQGNRRGDCQLRGPERVAPCERAGLVLQRRPERAHSSVTLRPLTKSCDPSTSATTASGTGSVVITTIAATPELSAPPPSGWRPTAAEEMLMPLRPNTVPRWPIMPGTSR